MAGSKTQNFFQYLRYLKERIDEDRVTMQAGYLTYITLLSLVPLATVLLTAVSKFDAFGDISQKLQDMVFSNFVPAAGEAVQEAMNKFIGNMSGMSTVGGVFVFITAMMLISNIDKNLNFIWRIKEKRSFMQSFSMYWLVLTLGPVLMGVSLALTSTVTVESYLSDEVVGFFYKLLPVIFSTFMFWGLYLVVPIAKVEWKHALIGGVVAAILFETAKKGFAMYIIAFPSYQLIYGALAAIPILFVWVYLSWMIILFGAEITASLGELYQEKQKQLAMLELEGKSPELEPSSGQKKEDPKLINEDEEDLPHFSTLDTQDDDIELGEVHVITDTKKERK